MSAFQKATVSDERCLNRSVGEVRRTTWRWRIPRFGTSLLVVDQLRWDVRIVTSDAERQVHTHYAIVA